MAKEITLGKIKSDSSEVDKTINSLQALKKAYKEAMIEAVDGSDEAAAKAGRLKDEINDLNEKVKEFAGGTKFEQFGNVLGGVGGKLKNLDFGGAAESANRLATISKSMTFKEVISGVKDLGSSLINLGKAILANPLFLLAAVIVAIVAAVYAFATAESELSKELTHQVDVLKELQTQINIKYDGELKLARAAGKETSQLEAEKLEAVKENVESQILLLNQLKDENGELTEEQIKDLKALKDQQLSLIYEVSAAKIAGYKKQSDDYKAAREKSEAEIKKYDENAKKRDEDAEKEREAKATKAYADYLARIEKQRQADLNYYNAKADLENQAIDKAEAFAKDLVAQAEQLKNDELIRLAATEEEKLQIVRNRQLAELDAEYNKSLILGQADIKATQALADAKYAIEAKFLDDVNTINVAAQQKKEADDRAAAQKRRDLRKQEANDDLAIAASTVQSLQMLSDMYFEYKSSSMQKDSAQELALRKKQFNINKAFQFAQTAIEGARSIISASSQQPYLYVGLASSIAASVATTAALAKIASTKFSGGEGTGTSTTPTPTVPSVSALPTSDVTTAVPKATTLYGTASRNNNVGSGGDEGNGSGSGNGGTVRAYVVESDVTNTQKKVAKYQSEATL